MERWKYHVPEGVQDFLPEECYYKRMAERKLFNCFETWGYEEIQTPSFEYYDVFAAGIGQVQQEQMHKMADEQGRILVLRPDLTLPIARVVATKLQDAPLPLRLCYSGNAFGYTSGTAGRQQEFAQMGIELLGVPGLQADAEVLAVAIEGLAGLGLTDFRVEVGQVAFFRGLLQDTQLPIEAQERLRQLVEEKNMPALRGLLDGLEMSAGTKTALLALPGLFGGVDMLEEARTLTENPACQLALTQLRQLYDHLCSQNLQNYLLFDLGMVQEMDYYSGVVFRGLVDGLGYPVLSGGRYDGLLGHFGRELSATGFAIGMQRLHTALGARGLLTGWQTKAQVWLIGWDADAQSVLAASQRINELRQQGKRVIQYLGADGYDGMIREAKYRNAAHCCYHSPQGVKEDGHV